MNISKEALDEFVKLSQQSMAETEAAVSTVFGWYERKIADLEMENVALRMQLQRVRETSLLDLV